MVILDLSRVDRKAQGSSELASYLFPFGPTPSHTLKSKRLTQLDNHLCEEKHTEFLYEYEMVSMWVWDTHSLIFSRTYTYNWLRDHTSWASSGIGVKIKSVPKNFWSLVLNFTASRYTFLFLNSKTYIVHVINCEWSRSVNFPLHIYLSNRLKGVQWWL